jgi:hypothetical protein
MIVTEITEFATRYATAWSSQVIFHLHWTGTNTGPGGTGNAVDLRGFEEWTLDGNGLILESRGHYDEAEYQRQLNAGTRGS